jgi:hypothetical protein
MNTHMKLHDSAVSLPVFAHSPGDQKQMEFFLALQIVSSSRNDILYSCINQDVYSLQE